jgi:hypothetical protein
VQSLAAENVSLENQLLAAKSAQLRQDKTAAAATAAAAKLEAQLSKLTQCRDESSAELAALTSERRILKARLMQAEARLRAAGVEGLPPLPAGLGAAGALCVCVCCVCVGVCVLPGVLRRGVVGARLRGLPRPLSAVQNCLSPPLRQWLAGDDNTTSINILLHPPPALCCVVYVQRGHQQGAPRRTLLCKQTWPHPLPCCPSTPQHHMQTC